MSAYENVELPMIMLGNLSEEEIAERTKMLLTRKLQYLQKNIYLVFSCWFARQNEPSTVGIVRW